jgi:hypothetical protein
MSKLEPAPKHIRDKFKEDMERMIAADSHLHCDRCGQDFYCNDAGWGHYRSCTGRKEKP